MKGKERLRDCHRLEETKETRQCEEPGLDPEVGRDVTQNGTSSRYWTVLVFWFHAALWLCNTFLLGEAGRGVRRNSVILFVSLKFL